MKHFSLCILKVPRIKKQKSKEKTVRITKIKTESELRDGEAVDKKQQQKKTNN